ncbi:hypothetical protein HWB90_gp092 [Mycobacterium phage Fowlmouth]|uniref:Uncharacterized protein n=1 Tax=Mycobacterium phage Fowlmouth TaxID=2419978 RepID=A0A3G2KGG2_9CAUD|nr:hypothetical protein HWB90_gp092 [Mycobacterium phage Fowlmouth]AYN58047.1 hypothetical protein SEA_FOWLMOUTH_98 [Mycobacterium phage Fowlmouth]
MDARARGYLQAAHQALGLANQRLDNRPALTKIIHDLEDFMNPVEAEDE